MDLDAAARAWQTDGFVILPGFIPAAELKPAVAELDLLFPTAEGFHDGTDPRRERFIGDEFAGIDTFPFASAEVSLLAVHRRVLALAETLLDEHDIHLYGAEAWAKYTGACDYEQDLHRDYLNHTILVPSTTPGCQQVEMFVFLTDVPEELGPPHLVSRKHTAHLPAVPNWLLRPGQESDWRFDDDSGSPQLYAAEVSGAGPACGTACTCASGPPASNGANASVGPFAASPTHGSSSSAGPPRASCGRSGSHRRGIRTGRRRRWPARRCATRPSTSRPGARTAPASRW